MKNERTEARKAAMPRVLVVDDDPDLVAICSLVLENEGYSIKTARNGVEAYDALNRERADVVLLDAMMPVMDGITVAKMVKRDPKTKDVPIVLMSASQHLCDQARDSVADAVITKPFNIDYLVSTINHFTEA